MAPLTEMTTKRINKVTTMLLNLRIKDIEDKALIEEVNVLQRVCKDIIRISDARSNLLKSVIKLEEKY